MKQSLYPNNLLELVGRCKNNPFSLWPNTTKENIADFLFKSIKEESNANKSFFFLKEGKVYLYFQILELPWDTKHFGYKCATVKHFYIDDEISFREVDEIRRNIMPAFEYFLKDEKIRFLSADIASQNNNGTYFIQALGFRFILNRIDGIWIPRQFGQDDLNIKVSNISLDEVEMFSKIATTSYYKEGRFYIDRGFDRHKVDNLYGELIKNSFLSNDIILSCRDGNNPIGVFICKQIKTYPDFDNLSVAHLRFLLVNPVYRNKSYGYRIFKATLEHLMKKCELITTGLESHNLISMNLHSIMGFKFTYSHNSFHFWNLI